MSPGVARKIAAPAPPTISHTDEDDAGSAWLLCSQQRSGAQEPEEAQHHGPARHSGEDGGLIVAGGCEPRRGKAHGPHDQHCERDNAQQTWDSSLKISLFTSQWVYLG